MFFNTFKTILLLSALSILMIGMGSAMGGAYGAQMAFIMALIMNGIMFFFSDKIVLRMYGARPLDRAQYPHIYAVIEELTHIMHLPMPKLWLIHAPHANAFATGRNPQNSSVALTETITQLLEPHELRGVLAHELSHIKNRDILVSTIAATIAATIGYLGNMIQHMLFWRSFSGSNKRNSNPFTLMIMAIFMPLIATILQLAVSRSREYLADETGAHYSDDPLALASALQKIQDQGKYQQVNKDMRHTTTASLFIVNPFLGKNIGTLFSTHPPTDKRIARLRSMFEKKVLK